MEPVDGLLLKVDDLHVEFRTRDGVAKAINGTSFTLSERETLAILGESGSGKSVTAQAIMGILESPPAQITGGRIEYCGVDLLTVPEKKRRQIRGEHISMIFQDALSSLNPVFPVGWQIAEMFRVHRGMNRSDSMSEAIRLMERVHIPAAKERANNYPHQFSGGMRQRIMIAIAIALNPWVLIADEPTTALDVTVQKQVIELIKNLQEKLGFAMVFVSHDLALVARLAHRITVMYAGQVVEQGDTSDLLADPRHEYTRGLLGAVLSIESGARRLHQVRGTVPSPREFAAGDRFAPRSEFAGVGADARLLRRTVAGTTHHYATTEELEIVRAAAREGERR